MKNNTHPITLIKFFLIFSENARKYSIAARLTILLVLIFSVNNAVRAVCQLPQFGLPIVISVTDPIAAAPGDFDRDGNLDLAVLKDNAGSSYRGAVEIFLGNGSGGFTSTGIQYNAVTIFPYDIAAADFNNDAILDLVVVEQRNGQNVMAVLLGNGNGGFSQPNNFSLPTFSWEVKVADINNDGNADVIVASGGAAVNIRPGLGNGSFSSTIGYQLQDFNSVYGVDLADFNNDGNLDFVATDDSRRVAVKLGNGSFVFSSSPQVAVPNSPNGITTADFNLDGKPDFATANENGHDVSVMLGFGDGTFNSPIGDPFSVGYDYAYPKEIVSADLTNDGYPDIATGNNTSIHNLSILLNNGNGTFGAATTLSAEAEESKRVYAVDFDKNGVTDLVVVKAVSQDKVVLLRNTCPAPQPNTQYDFDGDGRADQAVFRPSNGVWYLLESARGFSGVGFGASTDLIAPADFDGDKKTDIAVFRPSDGTWYLLQSRDGFAAVPFGLAGDIPVAADFDGDGKADICVFRPSTGAWFRINSGDRQVFAIGFGQNGDIPLKVDYDGDGKADIAVFRPGTATFFWFDSSTNRFRSAQFGLGTDIPVAADFDGDGKTDIAVFRPENGVWFFIKTSNNQFEAVQFGQNGDVPVAADFDGDGKYDIAVFRPTNGVWYLLQSRNGFAAYQFGALNDKPAPALEP